MPGPARRGRAPPAAPRYWRPGGAARSPDARAQPARHVRRARATQHACNMRASSCSSTVCSCCGCCGASSLLMPACEEERSARNCADATSAAPSKRSRPSLTFDAGLRASCLPARASRHRRTALVVSAGLALAPALLRSLLRVRVPRARIMGALGAIRFLLKTLNVAMLFLGVSLATYSAVLLEQWHSGLPGSAATPGTPPAPPAPPAPQGAAPWCVRLAPQAARTR